MHINKAEQNRLKKIFGIGPTGAIVSLLLLALSALIATQVEFPITADYAGFLTLVGVILAIFGLALHLWSFFALRHWWLADKLCTQGPFKYFRHPMYAAWISFICPGVALTLNSWFYCLWVLVLQLFWTQLVKKEEVLMMTLFGESYRDYAEQTGRFFPKILN